MSDKANPKAAGKPTGAPGTPPAKDTATPLWKQRWFMPAAVAVLALLVAAALGMAHRVGVTRPTPPATDTPR